MEKRAGLICKMLELDFKCSTICIEVNSMAVCSLNNILFAGLSHIATTLLELALRLPDFWGSKDPLLTGPAPRHQSSGWWGDLPGERERSIANVAQEVTSSHQ